MYYILVALLIATLPHTTFAATGSLQGLITGLGLFLDDVLIPVLLGIAFLALVWNVLRFFVIGGSSEEGQQNAKNLALYSVLTFVLILSFWGIVSILTNGIGLPSADAPCEDRQSDYFTLTDLSPCSSSNPLDRPEPTGSVGAAGGPVPPATTGSTGAAGGPVPPGTISFDIYGNPITTTVLGEAEKIARDTVLTLVKSAASSNYNTDFETLYGTNKETVAAYLFPDLIFPQTTKSDLERLRGAYRLSVNGEIGFDKVTAYTNATIAYNQQSGNPDPAITFDNIAKIAEPLPPAVITNIATTRAAFETAINAYNSSAPTGTAVPTATLTNLFNPNLTTTERVANFNSLMTSGFNSIVTNELRDTFLQNINTENAFAGKFTNPQI